MMKQPLSWPGLIVAIMISIACHTTIYPQEVVKYVDSTQSLAERWAHAHRDAAARSFKGYWVGYSINALMGERTFVGSYNSDRKKNRPTLREILNGTMETSAEGPVLNNMDGDFNGLFSFEDGNRLEKRIVKEIGILCHFRDPRSRELDEAIISNLSLHVDLKDDPLVWIGGTTDNESVDLLESLYRHTAAHRVQEKIITAVGMHPASEKIFKFLRSILLGSEIPSQRNEATFWLSQSGRDDAVELLARRAEDDPAGDVREQSVFCLSEMKNPGASGELIRLARDAKDQEIRKKAAFWIGQKVNTKIAAMREIQGQADRNTDIKKQAVFTLYQLPGEDGLNPLISIAQTHPDPDVRKEAVFWLSQSEDPRALDALIELLKN